MKGNYNKLIQRDMWADDVGYTNMKGNYNSRAILVKERNRCWIYQYER